MAGIQSTLSNHEKTLPCQTSWYAFKAQGDQKQHWIYRIFFLFFLAYFIFPGVIILSTQCSRVAVVSLRMGCCALKSRFLPIIILDLALAGQPESWKKWILSSKMYKYFFLNIWFLGVSFVRFVDYLLVKKLRGHHQDCQDRAECNSLENILFEEGFFHVQILWLNPLHCHGPIF